MPYLEWAGKLISNVKGLYFDMNPATFTGGGNDGCGGVYSADGNVAVHSIIL